MLNHCRALDLTDEKGFLCGRILAELGVDVIKVEKPGGDPSRRIGPFYHDIPQTEKSLYWFAYNAGKRGITLDIETRDGREIFARLVKTADFIIESFQPGFLSTLGLDYDQLCKLKGDIILTSITPFGQKGPFSRFQASDLVIMGMSGILYQTGDSDRPPVNMSLPQACLLAGADAAAGTLMAYYHREITGEGQHVDVSMQQSTAWFLANAIPLWELNGIISKRAGSFRWSINSSQRQVWRCSDGFVFFNIIGGRTGAKTLQELVKWMEEEGMSSDFFKSVDWETLDMFKATQETVDRISEPIEKFFKRHSKQEIAKGAAERGISICPLSSMADLFASDQLNFRKYWKEIMHPELNTAIKYPASFVRSSEEDYGLKSPAPLIGQHNAEIYREIGLSDHEILTLKQASVI